MPTFDSLPRFLRDYSRLTEAQHKAFRRARTLLVRSLKEGKFHPSLRIKRVQGSDDKIWEMTWAPDGRATFQYGDEVKPGEAHIIWRRIGTHQIFQRP